MNLIYDIDTRQRYWQWVWLLISAKYMNQILEVEYRICGKVKGILLSEAARLGPIHNLLIIVLNLIFSVSWRGYNLIH